MNQQTVTRDLKVCSFCDVHSWLFAPVNTRVHGKVLSLSYHAIVIFYHVFIISQLWLTSHPRSTVVVLDTGTSGTSREIYSENADGETRTRNPLGYKPSALAIELTSSKAIAGKEVSLSSCCIASLYIYHFSTVIEFSSEKYSGSTGHRNSWYQ